MAHRVRYWSYQSPINTRGHRGQTYQLSLPLIPEDQYLALWGPADLSPPLPT